MNFSLDSFLLPAPLSALVSIFMFFGCSFLGKKIIFLFGLKRNIEFVSDLNYQYILVGIIFNTLVLFPFILFGFATNYLLKFNSILLFFSGFILVVKFVKNINYKKFISYICNPITNIHYYYIVLFFFLSLAPITSADSLAYHIAIPTYIFNRGLYPADHLWFESVTGGSGEIINLLGLSLGSEMFGSLIQYSGLLSIIGIIKKNTLTKFKNFFLVIATLSSPVLLFLLTSAKPQLLYVGCISLCYSLIFFSKKNQNIKSFLKNIFFIVTLLLSAITAKFSFFLSFIILFICISYQAFKKKLFLKFNIIFLLLFIIILFPQILWRFLNYNGSIFSSIFPLPLHLYGYDNFYNSLASCGYDGCFPYWLIFPISIDKVTEFLGYSFFIVFFFYNYKNHPVKITFLVSFLFFIFANKFGPNSARFYLEPLLWILICASRTSINIKTIYFTIFKYLIYLQSFFVIASSLFGVYYISKGSLSEKLRKSVMLNNASGYGLHEWANKVLPKDSVVIDTHRSISLLNRKVIPSDFLNYINFNNNQSLYYIDLLKNKKPTHIIFYGNKEKYSIFEKCLKQQLYFKEDVGKDERRNPFSEQKKYDGYIYSLDYNLLPDCILGIGHK